MGSVAYCVAGRGGTAAAEGEEDDSSGSPSSHREESGAGSIDACWLEEEPAEWLERTEKDRKGSLEKSRRTGED